jgi:hypothetical protein
MAAGAFKHGRYSKYVPRRLLAKYEAAEQDPDLLSMRAEIALLDSRLQELLQRVHSGESGQMWRMLSDEIAQLLQNRDDPDRATVHINNLISIVRRGNADYAAWNELRSVVDQRRRLVDAERKRMVDAQLTMDVEQALLLLTVITGIIKDSVDKHVDRTTGNRILTETSVGIRQLVSGEAG